MSRTARTRRTGVALLAAWFLGALGPLLGDGQAHRFCVEHRLFEEVDSSADNVDAQSAPNGSAPGLSEAVETARHHVPCHLLTSLRRTGIQGSSQPLVGPALGVAGPNVHSPEDPLATLAPLSRAPKASPPLA